MLLFDVWVFTTHKIPPIKPWICNVRYFQEIRQYQVCKCLHNIWTSSYKYEKGIIVAIFDKISQVNLNSMKGKFNISRPGQNSMHCVDGIFQYILLNGVFNLAWIALKFAPGDTIDDMSVYNRSYNGTVPDKRLDITWTNDDQVLWCHLRLSAIMSLVP